MYILLDISWKKYHAHNLAQTVFVVVYTYVNWIINFQKEKKKK